MSLLKRSSSILGIAIATFIILNIAADRNVYSESVLEPKVTVLMYHDIAPDNSNKTSNTFTSKQFKEHLQSLQDGGYTIITMEQFRKFMSGEETVPERSVLITFDDGYQSFYKYAYTLLKQIGATASVFVIGAYSDVFHPDALPHLTWDEMRELKEAGMETKVEFRKRVRSDLEFMEKRLSQELGQTDGLLAIPFGIYDKAVLEEGRKAGISLFFTIKEGTNIPGSDEIFRINAGKPNFSGKQLLDRIRTVEKQHK